MNKWLEKELENRCVGEVSLYYAVTVMGTSMIFMCIIACTAVSGFEDTMLGTIVIGTALVLWLGFLIRLYWGIIKIGRIKLHNRPGGEIFNFLKIAIIVITAFQIIPSLITSHRLPEPAFWGLLAFDAFIVFSGLFFFPMAWLIGCKIPKKTYFDFAIMAAAIVIQIWATS